MFTNSHCRWRGLVPCLLLAGIGLGVFLFFSKSLHVSAMAPDMTAETPYAIGNKPVELFPVRDGGKYGFIKPDGTLAVRPQFDGARPFSEDRAAIRINSSWGFLSSDGTIAIPPQFDSVTDF